MDYALAAQQEAAAVCEHLKVGLSGLTPAEVTARRLQYGANRLPEAEYRTWWQLLLDQLRSPLVWLLGAAAAVSLLIGETTDAVVILVTTLINAAVGLGQKRQAERILADLKSLARPQALVQRGQLERVSAEQLVPGDIVILEEGARVPADGRLITANWLMCDESAFTGESLPVPKETAPLPLKPNIKQATNMVFMGTAVTHGRGRYVVTGTGTSSELGALALDLNETAPPPSPLMKQIDQLTGWFVRAIGLGWLILLLAGWLNNIPPTTLFLTAISVAVAALPEGLPLLITVVLVFGIRQLARDHALVRRVESVETLGQVQILITDKTGTLTKNQLAISQLILADRSGWRSSDPGSIRATDAAWHHLWNVIYHANAAPTVHWRHHPDPIDRVLMDFASRWPLHRTAGRQSLIAELPFDSTSKLMAAIYRQSPRKVVVYLKGAPEAIADLAGWTLGTGGIRRFSTRDRHAFQTAWRARAERGEKIIACAQIELSHRDWERVSTSRPAALRAWRGSVLLVGAVSFMDEIRPETVRTIATARAAGVRVVMATGDNAAVATAIGAMVGLRGPAAHRLPPGQRAQRALLARCDIFADVTPQMKLDLVQAWQKQGYVVGMTGDGVNDTPALAAADCGLALGRSGTDLAKDAADIVILNDDLRTIVRAVGQGRTTFRNIRRVVAFLISTNLSELAVVLLGTIAAGLWPLPLLPVQILWINLVSDSFSVIPLAIEPDHADAMDQPPRTRHDPLINRLVRGHIVTNAVVTALSVALGFLLAWRGQGDATFARTVAFSVLVGCQLMSLLATRSLKRPIELSQFTANPALLAAFLGGWILQIIIVHLPSAARWLRLAPLPATWWLAIIGLAALPLLALETRKRLFLRNPQAGD